MYSFLLPSLCCSSIHRNMATDYSQKSFDSPTCQTKDNKSNTNNTVSPTAESTATSVDQTVAAGTHGTQSASISSSGTTPTSSTPLPAITIPKSGSAVSSIGEKFTTEPPTDRHSKIDNSTQVQRSRGAMVPSLSLSYNSGSGNGIFGYGWDLSLNEITRKTDLGLPQYMDDIPNLLPENQDTFILFGSEDLVPELFYSSTDDTWKPLPPTIRTVDNIQYAVHRYRPRVERTLQRFERWRTTDSTGHSLENHIAR